MQFLKKRYVNIVDYLNPTYQKRLEKIIKNIVNMNKIHY